MISTKIVKRTFVDTLPILAGYLVLGFGFGFIMKSNGYGALTTLAMSVCIYAGSMQYVAIGLLTGGASLLTVALTTLMVNVRHLFYGISMIEKYRNAGRIKPYLIFALTDETYSLVCGEKLDITENDKKKYYFFVSLFNHIYWIIGTLLGTVIGDIVRFNSEGIEFALTALFITIFIEQWLSVKQHIPAIVGVCISAISLIVFGKDFFLIPAMVMIAIIFWFYKEKK